MPFLDARHLDRRIDRAHRDFLPEQIELLANVVRLYRAETHGVRLITAKLVESTLNTE